MPASSSVQIILLLFLLQLRKNSCVQICTRVSNSLCSWWVHCTNRCRLNLQRKCVTGGAVPYKMSAVSCPLAGARWPLATSPTATALSAHTLQETDRLAWKRNRNCAGKKKEDRRRRTRCFLSLLRLILTWIVITLHSTSHWHATKMYIHKKNTPNAKRN